ncbi:DUF349 domain-containing protein [Kandleria vitulina]|uniref:DUF349 domain-containing protein n=1 Tax=Kandleria vitulina TaxID=1630 RepID=UPI00332A73E7
MKRTKNIETFRDTEAIVEKNNDELTGLEKVQVRYGARNAFNQPISPDEAEHGTWLALHEGDYYHVLYWKRAPYEGGEVEIDDRDDFTSSVKTKQKLIQEAKDYSITEEWGKGVNGFKELMAKWKEVKYWHLAIEDEFWKAFQKAQSTFFERLRAHHDDNKKIKSALIQKAEELSSSDDFSQATAQLNALLEEWKQAGSAGNELDNKLWKEFRKYFDIFYKRKEEHWNALQPAIEEAKRKKEELIALAQEKKDSTEWKQTGNFYYDLMEQWKQAGYAGKDNDDLWARFNDARQTFYKNRQTYFDQLDAKHKQNASEKKKLIDEAKRLAHGLDYSRRVTQRMRDLQSEWKKIGSCGREKENALWKEFREQMDFYFDHLREFSSYEG